MTRLPNWRGRKVACLASGPSLTPEDCEAARSSGRAVIVTNSTFRLASWADALYGFDSQWWRVNLADVRRDFAGRLFTQGLSPPKGVTCCRLDPKFRSFGNAGANAVSLAIAMGAVNIVMLGYDCARGTNGEAHHFGDHPAPLRNCDTMPRWPAQFARLAVYAERRGANVWNASRATALQAFPRIALEDVL
jgi:hypothetical protein